MDYDTIKLNQTMNGGINMPIMKLHAIKKDDIIAISTSLIDELEVLLKCPRNYFVLELVSNTTIMDGMEILGLPRVEVYWFKRDEMTQNAFVQIITNQLHQIGYENLDVIFFELQEQNYYENGSHF